ncbi:MAG TPA: FAD-dependent oxidoreductase [Solirubrobacterales bacterium]
MTDSSSKPHIVVVGAGVAGLAAARRCASRGLSVTVLEREPRIGGRVRSIEVGGQWVDVGAQYVPSFAGELLAAIAAAGGAADLDGLSQKTAVTRDGATWDVGGAGDLLRGGLMSGWSRLRLPALAIPVAVAWRKLDPIHLARGADFDDASALTLLRRWVGEETAEAFVGPLLKGLLYWDLETTSQAVLLAMLKSSRQGSHVFRAPDGLENVVGLLAQGIDLRTGTTALRLERGEKGCRLRVRDGSGESELSADGVVCATTASAAAALIADPTQRLADFLHSVTYSKTALSVFRVPPGTAIPPSSHLFPARTTPLLASVNPPQGRAAERETRFMRISLSNQGFEELGDLDDAALASRSLAEARAVDPESGWTAEAEHVSGVRWEEALPRFDVGYLRREPLQNPASADVGRIVLAGDYLMAPHLEGAYRSGRSAADRLIAMLGEA